jgi:hypothetical protein
MLDDRTARINHAVDACLERLDNSSDARAELQAFVAERQGTLPEEELRTVETVVFRIILDREQRRGSH